MVNSGAKHGFKRAQRVSEEIRKAISEMLIRGDLHDPRLAMCTIMSVKLTDDLKNAHVYFSMLGDDVDHQDIERSFNRAAGFIKTQVGHRLKLRYTPAMKFIFDATLDTAARIDKLLKESRGTEEEKSEGIMIDQRDAIVEMIQRHESFLVITHENPDGDAIGAALALTLGLRQLGKEAIAYDVHPMPNYLTWLPGAEYLVDTADPAQFDALCVVDCGATTRVGPHEETIMSHPQIVNIDHHATNDGYGHANLVDSSASSASQLTFGVLQDLGVTITADIATNLYLGIYTDTMMFQNSASCPGAFRVCGDLMEAGADFLKVARKVYIETSAARLQLLGRVLSTLRLDHDGRIAGVYALAKDLKEFGMGPDDMEVFVEYPRSVIGAEAAYLLREEDGDIVKGSLRGIVDVDVSAVAAQLNGGGHKKAAGFKIEGTLEEIRERVVNLLTEALDQS